MVFCNKIDNSDIDEFDGGHNPYFNRWFSAISSSCSGTGEDRVCHNPYFNRWFSAIMFDPIVFTVG